MATTADTGLFGSSPWEIQQYQNQQADTAAQNFAKLSPTEKASYLTYKGGAGLADSLAPMFGGVDVAKQQAQQREKILAGSDVDLSSASGMRDVAKKFLGMGDYRTAGALTLKANELEKQQAAEQLAIRKQDFAEKQSFDLRKQQIEAQIENQKNVLEQRAAFQQALIDNKNASEQARAQAARDKNETLLAMKQLEINARLAIEQLKADARQANLSAKQEQKQQLKPGEEIKLRQAMGKDRSMINQVDADSEALDKKINDLVENTDGLSGITGISGQFYDFPGGEAARARADLEAIRGKLSSFGRTLQSQSGGKLGNMAVQEWAIVQNMIANLDTKNPNLVNNLRDAQAYLKGLSTRMKTSYADTYSPYFGDRPEMALTNDETPPPPASGASGGMKIIGKTPDGRSVYQDANGKKYVQ